jgi:hypothetical protein
MCCLELCLFGLGLVALFRGRFEWFGARVVAGFPARVVGVLLLIPVAVAGTLAAVRGYERGRAGQPYRLDAFADIAVMELLSWVVCLTAAVVIAFLAARPRPGHRPSFDYKAQRAFGPVEPKERKLDDFLPPR